MAKENIKKLAIDILIFNFKNFGKYMDKIRSATNAIRQNFQAAPPKKTLSDAVAVPLQTLALLYATDPNAASDAALKLLCHLWGGTGFQGEENDLQEINKARAEYVEENGGKQGAQDNPGDNFDREVKRQVSEFLGDIQKYSYRCDYERYARLLECGGDSSQLHMSKAEINGLMAEKLKELIGVQKGEEEQNAVPVDLKNFLNSFIAEKK